MKKRIPKEYLGAFKEGHRKTAREFIDDDFARRLLRQSQSGDLAAKEALDYLTRFNNEYYKTVFKKDETDLHSTPESKRERYNARYARHMDISNRALKQEGDWTCEWSEDVLIELIDLKRESEKSKKQ